MREASRCTDLVKRMALMALIAVVALSAGACGQRAAPSGASGDGGDRNAIVVGAIVSMTGMNAMTGAEQRWAYEQAVNDINAQGGVLVRELNKRLPIRLVFADDQSTAAEGAAAMERLITRDRVDFALSTNITPINIAAASVAEKYKVFYAANTSWLDQFGEQKYQWASLIFFPPSHAAEVPFLVWNDQPPQDRPQRIALMMEDNPDGQGFAAAIRETAEKFGYDIVVDEPYTPGTRDFSPAILRMKEANVDALLWLGSPTDSITLVRQIKEHQLNLRYLHGWKGFWPGEFLEALGEDADYIIHDGFWAETLPYPGARELGEKFRKAHDGRDSVSIGLPYATVQVLAQAIERAGTIDGAKVRDEVFGGKFEGTVMGDLQFDENGLAFTPSLALQWWQGKRMPVYPKGDYQLKWMPPWDQR